MSVQHSPHSAEFDQIYRHETAHETAFKIERDAINLADVAMRFAAIDRIPRYSAETRENDAEHSFMLGLVAQEVATAYFPELDSGLVARFALVHDLVELEVGDVATFAITASELRDKRVAEYTALEALCERLPKHTALLLRAYEEQDIPEARFVRFVDKMMPVLVDILGHGCQVMHEDYATFTHEQLSEAQDALKTRFEQMFPEPELASIHLARNGLARRFRECFTPLVEEQDTLF